MPNSEYDHEAERMRSLEIVVAKIEERVRSMGEDIKDTRQEVDRLYSIIDRLGPIPTQILQMQSDMVALRNQASTFIASLETRMRENKTDDSQSRTFVANTVFSMISAFGVAFVIIYNLIMHSK